MFVNNYMKKYQDVSILAGVKLPTTKNGTFAMVSIKIPYAIAKRTHLINDKVINEDMTGYSEGCTKQEPKMIRIGNEDYFGMKKGLN